MEKKKILQAAFVAVFMLVVNPIIANQPKLNDELRAVQSVDKDDFIVVDNISEFRKYIDKDHVKVKLKEGNYQIDDASCIRFMQFTGNNYLVIL